MLSLPLFSHPFLCVALMLVRERVQKMGLQAQIGRIGKGIQKNLKTTRGSRIKGLILLQRLNLVPDPSVLGRVLAGS